MDRLSSLPDNVIHTVLSLISLREAIGMCVLSSRWRIYLDFVASGGDIDVAHECVKRILDYASSHDVQQLSITTNTHARTNHLVAALKSKPTWGLTRLHLDNFLHSDVDGLTGIFSKCPNLKDLSLRRCNMWFPRRGGVVNICHPQLSNLTLEEAYPRLDSLKVVAPQLKNLTIINASVNQYLISAPGLTSLVIKGSRPLELNSTQGGGFPSLEKVDLCFKFPQSAPQNLVCLLHQLHNVKFLTLNLEILEVQPVTEIKINMLQDSFPSAIVTMISSEEIRGTRSIVSARKLIEEVRELLHDCTRYASWEMQRGRSSCWYFTMLVVSKLEGIKGLLTGLSASKRSAIQAKVSSVCEDAHVVTENFLEYINIQSNNKKSRFNDQFRETLDAGSIQSMLAWFQQTKNRLNQLPN